MDDSVALLAAATRQLGVGSHPEHANPFGSWWLERDPTGIRPRTEDAVRFDLEAEMRKFAEEAGISYEQAMAEVDDLMGKVRHRDWLIATSKPAADSRASRW